MTEENQPNKHATKAQVNERIEQVRGLLLLSMTKGDIKRLMREKYGLKHVQTERYLRYARNRNMEFVGKSKDEALSETLGYWSKKKQDAEQGLQRAARRLDGYRDAQGRQIEGLIAKEARLLAKIDDSNVSDELREHLVVQLDKVLAAMDDARKTAYSCRKDSMESQREIDKLLGNYAPAKVASTDSKGNDVPRLSEPVTPYDAAREMDSLAELIRQRGATSTN